jgi:hypothetical protein
MIYYRLVQDHEGLPEGATITEDKFKSIPYLSKCYFEVVEDYQVRDFVEYENDNYCVEHGIEKMLFYNERELDLFLTKRNELQYK